MNIINPMMVLQVVQSDSLYNEYDKKNPSEADSSLRHCLACNRLGHDARNCPCPSTAMILAHYQILEEIRKYKTLATDGTVMRLEVTIMHPHSQEPFDEPDYNWPKMLKFGNFMQIDTFVDSEETAGMGGGGYITTVIAVRKAPRAPAPASAPAPAAPAAPAPPPPPPPPKRFVCLFLAQKDFLDILANTFFRHFLLTL